MFCHNCGTQLLDGAIFCHECGTNLKGTERIENIKSGECVKEIVMEDIADKHFGQEQLRLDINFDANAYLDKFYDKFIVMGQNIEFDRRFMVFAELKKKMYSKILDMFMQNKYSVCTNFHSIPKIPALRTKMKEVANQWIEEYVRFCFREIVCVFLPDLSFDEYCEYLENSEYKKPIIEFIKNNVVGGSKTISILAYLYAEQRSLYRRKYSISYVEGFTISEEKYVSDSDNIFLYCKERMANYSSNCAVGKDYNIEHFFTLLQSILEDIFVISMNLLRCSMPISVIPQENMHQTEENKDMLERLKSNPLSVATYCQILAAHPEELKSIISIAKVFYIDVYDILSGCFELIGMKNELAKRREFDWKVSSVCNTSLENCKKLQKEYEYLLEIMKQKLSEEGFDLELIPEEVLSEYLETYDSDIYRCSETIRFLTVYPINNKEDGFFSRSYSELCEATLVQIKLKDYFAGIKAEMEIVKNSENCSLKTLFFEKIVVDILGIDPKLYIMPPFIYDFFTSSTADGRINVTLGDMRKDVEERNKELIYIKNKTQAKERTFILARIPEEAASVYAQQIKGTTDWDPVKFNYGNSLRIDKQIVAMKMSLNIPDDEIVFWMESASSMGSFKEKSKGFAVCSKGFYYRNDMNKVGFLQWSAFAKQDIKIDIFVYVGINGFNILSVRKEPTVMLLKELQKVIVNSC